MLRADNELVTILYTESEYEHRIFNHEYVLPHTCLIYMIPLGLNFSKAIICGITALN